MSTDDSKSLVAPLLCGAAAFALYMLTLVKGPVHWDAPLWAFCANRAHPWITGYPLYILLSYPFAHLSVGTLMWRVALLSAIAGAVACALLCYICAQFKVRPIWFVPAALLFALAPRTWETATVPEVYSLFWTIFALVLILAIATAHGNSKAALLLIFVYGISFTHHLLTVTLAPAVVFALAAGLKKEMFNARNLLVAAATALLVIILYAIAYFLQKAGAMGNELVLTPREFVNNIAGGKYRSWMFAGGQTLKDSILVFWKNLVLSFPTPLWIASLAGIGIAFARDKKGAAIIVLAAAGIFVFSANYRMREIATYFVPVYFALAITLATLFDELARHIKRKALTTLLLLLFVPAIPTIGQTYSELKDRQVRSANEYAKVDGVIRQLKPNSLLWIPNERLANAFAVVAEEHPTLNLEIFGISPHKEFSVDPLPRIERALAQGRTIYVFGPQPDIKGTTCQPVSFETSFSGQKRELRAWILKKKEPSSPEQLSDRPADG